MRKELIVLLLIIIASCNNEADETEIRRDSTIIIEGEKDSTDLNPTTEIPNGNATGCYVKILGRDTMVVKLNQVGDSITGTMLFDNFEKDGSRGTVHGTIKKNTIKLWYDFESEGMQSVMEIWFRIRDKHLVRGIGSFGVKGDTSYYTNPPDIQYEDDQLFEKVKCDK